jgi:signal peptidase II
VVALDQWTKYLIRANLEFGEIWVPFEALPCLRIVHWTNTGSAFGFFPSGGLLFTVVAVVVAGAILYYFPRVPQGELPLRLALSLQMGGAVGNLIDRLAIGTVTDFVAVGGFPVFNVADSSITIGVAVLLGAMVFGEMEPEAQEVDSHVEVAESTPQAELDASE